MQAAGWTPSQLPPQTEPSVAQAARLPCGAPIAVEHVPTLPARLHASHWPVHARPQQTPSTHSPEAHSMSAAQAVPCDLMKVAATACGAVTFAIAYVPPLTCEVTSAELSMSFASRYPAAGEIVHVED